MKGIRRIGIGIGFAAAVLLCGVAFGGGPPEGQAGAPEAAPAFEAVTVKGETVSLEGLLSAKEAVLLNFWGIRCGACLQEIPHLNALFSRYRDRVAFLGVNADGADAAFLRSKIEKGTVKIEFEVVPDPELKLIDLFKMNAAPLTIIVDRGKAIRYRHENYEEGDEVKIEKALNDSLAGSAPRK